MTIAQARLEDVGSGLAPVSPGCPRSETALAHGAGVEAETPDPPAAYAPFPAWRLGRVQAWDDLPWA